MTPFIIFIAIAILILFVWKVSSGHFSGLHSESASQGLKNISPQEAYALIREQQKNSDFIILDVRTPDEFKQAFIEKAVNIDFYSRSFQTELQGLDLQKTYLVYCRSGNRSAKALRLMQKLGFADAYNMTGGIIVWKQQGLPLVQ